jgi:hypothetical protein
MKRLTYLAILIASVLSCSDDEGQDLSGRYNFIEPPHYCSRIHRLDFSQIAFDVIFTIEGHELSEIDMVLGGVPADDELGGLSSGDQLIFEGGEGIIELLGIKKVGNSLHVKRADFTLDGARKSYGPLQIDQYTGYDCDGSGGGQCTPENRTGAYCNDGTYSTATSSGACSSHGGVRRWNCN